MNGNEENQSVDTSVETIETGIYPTPSPAEC